MKSRARPKLAGICLTTSLALTLAVLLTLSPSQAAPAAGVIRVPDDYATIQQAIDAANDGDTIRVIRSIQGNDFKENLSITKAITLSGGWSLGFTQTVGTSSLDAQGLGRAISITCASSASLVTVEGFSVINGNATGLGGAPETQPAVAPVAASARSADALGWPERVVLARAHLAQLYAEGRWPGDEASHRETLQRLERWAGLAGQAAQAGAPETQTAPAAPGAQVDCGGGIYVRHARLRLVNSVVADSVASASGAGYGGGVCVIGAPADGLDVQDVIIYKNVASQAGPGAGGGVYVAQSEPGSVTLRRSRFESNLASNNGPGQGGALAIVGVARPALYDNTFDSNIASRLGDGQGGGVYLANVDQADLSYNSFLQNAATSAGANGQGGGLNAESGQGQVIAHNTFLNNVANGAWAAQDATGGGAFLSELQDSRFENNQLERNLAGVHAHSRGGGLAVQGARHLSLTDNTISKNWGVLFQLSSSSAGGSVSDGGGGVYIYGSTPVTMSGNLLANNVGVVDTVFTGTAGFGGGMLLMTDGNLLADNTFAGNTATMNGAGFGGGLSAFGASDLVIRTNVFTGNVGAAHGMATGGGADVRQCQRVLAQRNRFENNTASLDSDGSGGGLMMGGLPDQWGHLTSYAMAADANLFLRNAASRRGQPQDSAGGGLYIYLTQGVTATNNVAAGNLGGMTLLGAYAFTPDPLGGRIVNNTLAGNGQVGLALSGWYTAPAKLVNNSVTSHTIGVEVQDGDSVIEMSYTLLNGNGTDVYAPGSQVANTHIVTGPARFVNPAADDYHLRVDSAARDAGDPAGSPPAPGYDADGQPRPFGARVDLGAYEWRGYQVFLPIVRAPCREQCVGWIIGDSASNTAIILHTADGGGTWSAQGDLTPWPSLSGWDISAVDAQTAWAALGNETHGAILHTADGGATWISQTLPAGVAGGIKGVKGLSRYVAWAASLRGTILHTTDGGKTWNIVPHPTVPITQVNRMDAIGDRDVWIADVGFPEGNPFVIHTQDSGLTWRREPLPEVMPGHGSHAINAYSPQVVWSVVNAQADLYRTLDGGEHWVKAAQVGGPNDLDDICAASAETVWGVLNISGGSGGNIYRVRVAADGVVEVQTFDPAPGHIYEGMTCLDDRIAWVVGYRALGGDTLGLPGVILHTLDGGEHWTQQAPSASGNFWKVSFVGARR